MRSLVDRYSAWVGRRFAPEARPHEIFEATTADGWHLPIRRYGARGPAVVLCHGLGSNHVSFEVSLERSLAPWLARSGFDVFVVGLRATANTRGPDSANARFGVAELCELDAPAVAGAVRAVASGSVAWVGHSLGGLVGLLAARRCGIHAVVALGAPLATTPRMSRWIELARRGARLLGHGARLPQARLARLEAPWMGRVPLPGALSFISPPGLHPEDTRRLHAHAVEDLPRGVLDDLDALSGEAAGALSPAIDRELASGVPKLLLVGQDDVLATPAATDERVRGVARACEVRELGRRWGHRGGYAHVELAAGRYACVEVFPVLAAWLRGTL